MRTRRRTLHPTVKEHTISGLVLLGWIIEVGALILLAKGMIPPAPDGMKQAIVQSTATTPWPATWTPAPTSTPATPIQPIIQPIASNPPEACYVETPTNLGKMLYSLDCEVTALWYLVQSHPRYRGLVERNALYNTVIYHDNPNKGFRGNMNGTRPGNSDRNYGLHAHALVEIGRRAGIPMEVIRSIHELRQRLCQGEPVIAWVRSTPGRQAPVLVRSYQDSNGTSYYTVAYEHAVLVTGYDQEMVRYRNPSDGRPHAMSWQQFEQEIRLFGKQMVVAAQVDRSH